MRVNLNDGRRFTEVQAAILVQGAMRFCQHMQWKPRPKFSVDGMMWGFAFGLLHQCYDALLYSPAPPTVDDIRCIAEMLRRTTKLTPHLILGVDCPGCNLCR